MATAAARKSVPPTTPEVSPFKARTWVAPGSAPGPVATTPVPTPPVTPSPGKRSRLKGRSRSRAHTECSAVVSVWQPPSPWLSGRVDWSLAQGGSPRDGPRAQAKRRPQSALELTAAEGAVLSPHIQTVEDLVANGPQVFLGYEHEKVCHYQQLLHYHERQRRAREATLRRLRDESQSLKGAEAGVVSTDVARLFELELQLDQAYRRHHAQTLAKQKADTRIEALREKLLHRDRRVADKRLELAMAAEEVVQRGEALAESRNQAQQVLNNLAELQVVVVRQSAARKQELGALHAHLGLDVLAQDIQSLQQQLRDLEKTSTACDEAHERQAANEKELEHLRRRAREERVTTAALVAKRQRFEVKRRSSHDARHKLLGLRAREGEVAASIATLRSELDNMQQLADRRDACEADLVDAKQALKARKDQSLQERRNALELEHSVLMQTCATLRGSLTQAKSAGADSRAKASRLKQALQEDDARLRAQRSEVEKESRALELSAGRAREQADTTEIERKRVRRRLDQIAAEQRTLGAELADAKKGVSDLQEMSSRLRVSLSKKSDPSAIQSELSQINAELAAARNRSDALLDELGSVQRLDETVRRTSQQLKDENEQLTAVREQESNLRAECTLLRDQIHLFEAGIVEAETRATAESTRADQFRQAIARVTSDVDAASKAASTALEEAESQRSTALLSVRHIDPRMLLELRSMPRPPAGVELTLSAVFLILGKSNHSTWVDIRAALQKEDFTKAVTDFVQTPDTTISQDNLQALVELTDNEDFNEARVMYSSKAAGQLCLWVKAQLFCAQEIAKQKSLSIELEIMEGNLAQLRQELAGATCAMEEAAKLEQQLQTARSDLKDRTAELHRLENPKTSLEENVSRLQDQHETACRELIGHQTEATVKNALDQLKPQMVELEHEAQLHSADLQSVQALGKEQEDIISRLSQAKKLEQEKQQRSDALMKTRDHFVAEHQKLEGVISAACGVAQTNESRAKEVIAKFMSVESDSNVKRADTQAEIASLLSAAEENDHAIAGAEMKLAEVSQKIENNETTLVQVKSAIAMQSSHLRKVETQHNDNLEGIVVTLGRQLESLREQQALQRSKVDAEAELQELSLLSAQLAQATVDAQTQYNNQQVLVDEDTKLADTMDDAVGAAEAAETVTAKAITQLLAKVEQDKKSSALLDKAVLTARREKEQIRDHLQRLKAEMALKTSNRPTEIDPKTGAIVPPHQTKFDSRWTLGAPVGKTERLRCLSAGPSPNRPAAAWPSTVEAHRADKDKSRSAIPSDVGNSTRQKLLEQAWHAITHATGRVTEAEITGRLLEHAEEHEMLQINKIDLDAKRASLRDTLRDCRQELANVMRGVDVPSASLVGQRDVGGEVHAGEQQLQSMQQQLRDADVQLRTNGRKLSSMTRLLAAVGPGLKQLGQTCGSGVLTDLGINTPVVNLEDDDEASLLSMVEQRISFVLDALQSAGLVPEGSQLEVRVLQLGQAGDKSPRTARGQSKEKVSRKNQTTNWEPGLDPNVRVPSRAMREQHVAAGSI